eukprot:CAMPEP_0174337388 /NCGR_PEP_ID=MMETSP0810-20121108/22263_1 /TAXON_ID=73025 ORGANISM="Eutreptiella gymnastica-like, Strain CCMP1594" /NCGR_SAMPLE_ID=MMETSP0810 /ASSEMBLY_ACC=CAM_ASM_000659 /LENGTH=405 /DNA_ID=CAMNT_0015456777 /DNA_START=26 /DNA_END=1240 /DNA_ORIENTATION=-
MRWLALCLIWTFLELCSGFKPFASSNFQENVTPEAKGGSKKSTCLQLKSYIGKDIVGAYHPECTKDGQFAPLQCWGSTGYCWCSTPDGVPIANTVTFGLKVHCEGANDSAHRFVDAEPLLSTNTPKIPHLPDVESEEHSKPNAGQPPLGARQQPAQQQPAAQPDWTPYVPNIPWIPGGATHEKPSQDAPHTPPQGQRPGRGPQGTGSQTNWTHPWIHGYIPPIPWIPGGPHPNPRPEPTPKHGKQPGSQSLPDVPWLPAPASNPRPGSAPHPGSSPLEPAPHPIPIPAPRPHSRQSEPKPGAEQPGPDARVPKIHGVPMIPESHEPNADGKKPEHKKEDEKDEKKDDKKDDEKDEKKDEKKDDKKDDKKNKTHDKKDDEKDDEKDEKKDDKKDDNKDKTHDKKDD